MAICMLPQRVEHTQGRRVCTTPQFSCGPDNEDHLANGVFKLDSSMPTSMTRPSATKRNAASKSVPACWATFSTFAVGLIASMFVSCLILAMYDFNFGLAPNECIEFPENPLYTEVPMEPEVRVGGSNTPGLFSEKRRLEDPENELFAHENQKYIGTDDPPYRLMHVLPQGQFSLGRQVTDAEIWGRYMIDRNTGNMPHTERSVDTGTDIALPVLFVPGHGGSYNQSKASAAQAIVERLSAAEHSVRLNYFALDFLEVPSGIDASLIYTQARCINRAIRTILSNYRVQHKELDESSLPSSVLVLAHSMGGIAARAAPFMRGHVKGSISSIVTLNSPHQAHPFGAEGGFRDLYLRLNKLWSNPSMWKDESDGGTGLSSNIFKKGTIGVLSNMVVASITGGSRDHVVRADLSSMRGLAPKGRALHVWTTALPGVWIETDHDAIVWCGQLVAVLSRALMSMHRKIDDIPGAAGFHIIASPFNRLKAFEESLFGRSQQHWRFAPFEASQENRKVSVATSRMENGASERVEYYRKTQSTIISRSESHSFVGRKWLRQEETSQNSHEEKGVEHRGSLCVPMPMDRDLTKSMSILTDMAPFSQVKVSICSTPCMRRRQNVATLPDARMCRDVGDFTDGIAGTRGDIRLPGDIDRNADSASASRILVLPHSRRRRHLHHSYDPLMHFGRERHHHRWSRVTAADLIDEATYRHSGSIHAIVLSPKELSTSALDTTSGSAQKLANTVKSVHIHFPLNANNGVPWLPSKSKRNEEYKDPHNMDWFLQTQLFHDPKDLRLKSSRICTTMRDANTTTTPNEKLRDFFSQWSHWIFAALLGDSWTALAGHPWLVEVENCGIPYSRFTPQKLTVTRLSCMSKMPTWVDLNIMNAGDADADSPSWHGQYDSHFFAPVLRFQLTDPESGVLDEEIIKTEPATVGGEDEAELESLDINASEKTESISVFILKGHDFSRQYSRVRIEIVMDPRCSYHIEQSTYIIGVAAQLVHGCAVFWLPAYHSMLLLLLSIHLFVVWKQDRYSDCQMDGKPIYTSQSRLSLWVIAKWAGLPLAVFQAIGSWILRKYLFDSAWEENHQVQGPEGGSSLLYFDAPGLGIPVSTRSPVLECAVHLSALGAVLAVHISLLRLSSCMRLFSTSGINGVLSFLCKCCGKKWEYRAAGYGSAPGFMESSGVASIYWIRRCMYRRHKQSVMSLLMQLLTKSGNPGSSGDTIAAIGGVTGGRERKDSNMNISDVEENTAYDEVYPMSRSDEHQPKSFRANFVSGNAHGQRSQAELLKNTVEVHQEGFSEEDPSAPLSKFSLRAAVRGTSTMAYCILFAVQVSIILGLLVFSPLIILVFSVAFLLAFTVIFHPTEGTEFSGGSEQRIKKQEQSMEGKLIARADGHKVSNQGNRSETLLQINSGAGSPYLITCLQFYLSILALRAPAIIMAFLQLNPNKYLDLRLNMFDSLVVLPFVTHIVLMLRAPCMAKGGWLVTPAVLGLLTALVGVVFLDRSPYLIPALNTAFALSLSLAHVRACFGQAARLRSTPMLYARLSVQSDSHDDFSPYQSSPRASGPRGLRRRERDGKM